MPFRNFLITSSGTGGTVLWPTGTLAMGGLVLTGAGAINGITLSGTSATLTLATSAAVTLTGPVQVNFTGFGTLATSISGGKTLTLSATDDYILQVTGTGVAVLENATQTLTNKTLTAPKFADLGFIADANGNELVIFDTVASAVNEVTFANAATGNPPTFTASGGDTNIGIKLVAKGTGAVQIPDGAVGTPSLVFASDTDTGIFREASNELRISAGGVSAAIFKNDGTNTHFGQASSPITRVTATGEMYFSMQAYSGASMGVRLGDAAAKFYVRAAASPTANAFEVQNSSGTVQASISSAFNLVLGTGKLIVTTSQTPASASDTGTTGTIAWDSSYIYVCTATNTWKRVAIATW